MSRSWPAALLHCLIRGLGRNALSSDARFVRFLGLLKANQAEHDYTGIVAIAHFHRACTRAVRRHLMGKQSSRSWFWWRIQATVDDALTAAEIIGAALIATGYSDSSTATRWFLPLLTVSTGTYLPKQTIAAFLFEHLDGYQHPEPVVAAVEAAIAPCAWDDYSNFHGVFRFRTWQLLRPLLTRPRLVTALDGFVTRIDRREFWITFCDRRVN